MLPQLDISTYTAQIFWLCITFAALYIGIERAVLPRMRSVLQQRAFRIESDMQKAEEFRKEAEAILTEYDRMLADTKQSSAAVIEEAKKKADADISANEASAEASVREKVSVEYARIDAFRTEAKAHINETSADTAEWIMTALSLKDTANQVN